MRLYLDCEFDGFGGDLISMALVAEDARKWYGIMPPKGAGMYQDWVFDNVVPVLFPLDADIVATSRWDFNSSLHEFLKQFDNPIIIADWYTDFVHFFQCFQGRDHTESFAYRCSAQLRTDLDGYVSEIPHNALSDALAIRDALK
jgi:hypothetical protein